MIKLVNGQAKAVKARGDSVLGTLSKARQKEIYEYCSGTSLAKTVIWLKEQGIQIEDSALGRWYESFSWVLVYDEAASDTEEMEKVLREEQPEIPEEKVQRFGANFFTRRAIKLKDSKTFLKVVSARNKAELEKVKLAQGQQALTQHAEALKLEREKFEWNGAEACLKHLPELRAIATNPRLSNNERIQEIRKRLFGTLPEAVPSPDPGSQIPDPGPQPPTP